MANLRIKDLKQGKTVWRWKRLKKNPDTGNWERIGPNPSDGYVTRSLILKCKTIICRGDWPRVMVEYSLRETDGNISNYSVVAAIPIRMGKRCGILSDAMNLRLHDLYDRATIPDFCSTNHTPKTRTLK